MLHGFGDMDLWGMRGTADLIVFTSLAAAVLAIAVSIRRRLVQRTSGSLIAVAVIGASIAIIFARVTIFSNHSYFHPLFIGKYMFVPVAPFWPILIAFLWESASFIPIERTGISQIDSGGIDGSGRA